LPNEFDLRIIGARASRMTTPAGAEAGLLRRFGNLKKADLLPSRATRGTRWAAVDPRRAHRENKAAVARGIARKHCIPKLGIVHYVRHCCHCLQHFTSPLPNLLRR